MQQGEIKEVTPDTYLNNSSRVFEGLVFTTEPSDIKNAMKRYGYRGYYGKVIRDLKQIVEQRHTE